MTNVSREINLNPFSNNATDHGVHLDLTELTCEQALSCGVARVGLITQIILTTIIFPFHLDYRILLMGSKVHNNVCRSDYCGSSCITWCQVELSSLLFPTRFCTAKRFAIRNESRLTNSPARTATFFKRKQGFKDNGVCGRLSRPLFHTIIDLPCISSTWKLITRKICQLCELLSCAHYAKFAS